MMATSEVAEDSDEDNDDCITQDQSEETKSFVLWVCPCDPLEKRTVSVKEEKTGKSNGCINGCLWQVFKGVDDDEVGRGVGVEV